jgi:hypothetical protein
MEQDIDSIPFDQWEIELDSQPLMELLNDDSNLQIENLSQEEKESIDMIVVGREHGARSTIALLGLIEDYQPNVIIHESVFNSAFSKRYADIMTNGIMFGVKSLAGVPSKGIQIGDGEISVDEYLMTMNDPDTDDVIPLVLGAVEKNKKVVIRHMGETEANLHSLTGVGLQEALATAPDEDALLTEEAQKILLREDVMMADINRIVANIRKKVPLADTPQLNVMVVAGLFHVPFLHDRVKHLPISPRGIASLAALDGQRYNLETGKVTFLPTDEQLFAKVLELRNS